MWKKILIIVLVLMIGAVAGFFAYRYLNLSSNPIVTLPAKQEKVIKDLAHYDNYNSFQWGATMRPFALGEYDPALWQKEISVAKQLGIGWARLGWESDSSMSRNDDIINRLLAQKINPVMVIEKRPNSHPADEHQQGYDDGFKLASHFKGKIHFYQLMNEVSAQATISNTSAGQKLSDYDPTKYQEVTAYLRGLSEGITKADSNAWMIVPIAYTQTGFIDKILQDKIKFDIIGLDWYDWAGDIATKKMDDGTLFSEKLKSYHMPVMFMEVNAVPQNNGDGTQSKTKVDEQKQSDFISQTAEWAYKNKDFVKGFYVHELIDNVNNPNGNFELFGIYTATKDKGKQGVLGSPRKAFNTYKAIIQKYKS